jgi:hypothetical protein
LAPLPPTPPVHPQAPAATAHPKVGDWTITTEREVVTALVLNDEGHARAHVLAQRVHLAPLRGDRFRIVRFDVKDFSSAVARLHASQEKLPPSLPPGARARDEIL